jgi:hypothetical protein
MPAPSPWPSPPTISVGVTPPPPATDAALTLSETLLVVGEEEVRRSSPAASLLALTRRDLLLPRNARAARCMSLLGDHIDA